MLILKPIGKIKTENSDLNFIYQPQKAVKQIGYTLYITLAE